jgi:transcriptional regulator with XRE-family HTH domain
MGDWTFKSRLREAREAKGWSQTDLATRTGLEPSAISHFECGRREPSAGNLVILAIQLQVSTDYLLGLKKPTTRRIVVAETQERITEWNSFDEIRHWAEVNHYELREMGGTLIVEANEYNAAEGGRCPMRCVFRFENIHT